MGIAERKERDKERRREEIINAAEKVFFSKGFDQSTVEEIAAEAELSKGTVYLYFSSKEDLHYAIIVRALEKIRDKIIENLSPEQKGVKNLEELANTYVRFCHENKNYFDAIVHFDSSRIEKVHEDKRIKIMEENSPLMLLVKVIQKGIEDGSIKNEFNSLELAITLWAQLSGLLEFVVLRSKLIEKLELNPHQMVLNSFRIALSGISTEEQKDERQN